MNYCPIASVLAYILNPERTHTLLVHRIARPTDEQLGKYNGLGGHLERNEDIGSAILREIREESTLEVTSMTFRGSINWTGFGPHGEDWIGFVFLVTGFKGTPCAKNEEGPLEWVPLGKIYDLSMWEGDRHFLPLVFDSDPRPFHGYMPYDNGRPLSWSYTRL